MNYQTIVLSGGGAKGPYGLGVLLALEKYNDKYYTKREKDITKIYCGTSVGALNATIAAQGDLAKLAQLYSEIRTEDILGVSESELKKLRMLRVAGRKPFHYFDSAALKATIRRFAKFDRLADTHLLICATNYSTGVLETFYISSVVDAFVKHEQSHPQEKRRLTDYHRIDSQENLVQVLLASAAIPFYQPPVKIGNSLYVDGDLSPAEEIIRDYLRQDCDNVGALRLLATIRKDSDAYEEAAALLKSARPRKLSNSMSAASNLAASAAARSSDLIPSTLATMLETMVTRRVLE